jgi:flagellar hook-associated protein 1 FlgK
MSGISSAIDTALSGLALFEAGINTVAENLANQSTPGYAAESVSATTVIGQPGEPGQGVSAPIITRAANSFAAGLLNAATGASQAASVQSAALTAISNALQNNGDVQTEINQFFNDVGTLAANPSSGGQRQTVLSDLQNVTGAFQSAATGIADTQAEAGTALAAGVTQANGYLSQLATINKGLQTAPSDPNLLDQQQAALNNLSGLLNINVVPQANGQIILTAGGTTLLDQTGVQALTLTNSGTAAPTVTAGNDNIPVNVSGTDGAIGGNIASYQAGIQALQALNARAAIFTQTVNTAQAQGLTAAGNQGGPLISVPAPTATAASTNTGTATAAVQISPPSQLPTDGGPFLLTYSAANGWGAIDQSSGQTYAIGPGTNLAFAGLTVAIGGAPNPGDKFLINPAPAAAANIAPATSAIGDIAAADPYVSSPGVLQANGSVLNSNAGTIAVGPDNVATTPATGAAVIPASYFGQDLQVTFTSPTAYNVTTSADTNTVIASGNLSNANGTIAIAYPATSAAAGTYYQQTFTASPVAGDALTLTPGGGSSGSNASRPAALYTTSSTTTDGTLQQSFVDFASTLGANAQQAQQRSTSATAQVTSATDNLQNISGVTPDQQAVILTNYQQAYQAAAQVISTAHSLFESLLQSLA